MIGPENSLFGDLQSFHKLRNREIERLGESFQSGQANVLLSTFHVGDVAAIYAHFFRHDHLSPALLFAKLPQTDTKSRGDALGGHSNIIGCRLLTTNRPKAILGTGKALMEKPLHLFGGDEREILAECADCGRVLRIPTDSATQSPVGYFVLAGITCKCGISATEILAQPKPNPTNEVPPENVPAPSQPAPRRSFGTVFVFLFVAVLMALLIGLISVSRSIQTNPRENATSRSSQARTSQPAQLIEHNSIKVGENTVYVGDLSDDALPLLKPYIISNSGHRPDPRPGMSGSMMIWYYCDTVGGQTWTVELARRDMDSPYVVYRITEGEHNYQLGEN